MLAGIFHLDVPTGNIPLKSAQELAKNPLIRRVVPLSIADTLPRLTGSLGTTPDYIDLYHGAFASGRAWNDRMQAVLGATVAARTGLGVGDSIRRLARLGRRRAGAWRFGLYGGRRPETDRHGSRPARARQSGQHLVRARGQHHGSEERKVIEDERQVTVLLVQYATPLAAVSLPRKINAETNMQAASPAYETARLFRMIGVGADVIRAFGGVVLATAALSLFIALYHALNRARLRHRGFANARRASGKHRDDADARSADAGRTRRRARPVAGAWPRRHSRVVDGAAGEPAASTHGRSRRRNCGCWCLRCSRQRSRPCCPVGVRRTRTSRRRSRAAR